jgi:hypothetical protein
MNTLRSICYCRVMLLLIRASHERRDRLLSILPDGMADEVTMALRSMTKAGGRLWRKQVYWRGLSNHCFRRVVGLLVERDDLETEMFLAPLGKCFTSYLLKRYQDVYKWETDGTRIITTEQPLLEAVLLQYQYSNVSYFEYYLYAVYAVVDD